jgi:hypothetical protein
LLAIEDGPPRARTRSLRPTAEERAALAEARAAARAAKEDEKTRHFLDREEKKMNREIARAALEYERNRAREERGRRMASTRGRAQEQPMNRPGRSPSRPRIDPQDLAAAAEAALKKPRPKAKATVEEVVAMATERFGKGARAKAKAAVKKQLKDTIRCVPVKDTKPRRPRGTNKKALEESAVAAVAAA